MYCTIDNIIQRIGETALAQLADDLDAGVINEQIVTNAIVSAGATIDAYCKKYYTVPISPVPAKIADLCVDIAAYDLYSRSDLAMPEIRKERKEAAIRFLEKVSEGKIDLGVSTPAPAYTNNSVEFTNNERVFTKDKMSNY